jgi:hypothetical protein
MREVVSVFTFGIVALCFVTFFAVLKPNVVSVARWPGSPDSCSMETSPKPVCRPHVLAAGSWLAVAQGR